MSLSNNSLPARSGPPLLVGVDTGGTFTDLVLWDEQALRHCKVLSTPQDPSLAILEGLERLGVRDAPVQLVHGTTVGTNAVLEGKGARVAYVTSAGFRDVLTLARQNRSEVYALEQPPLKPPVPEALCLEVATRVDAEGRLLARAHDRELEALAAQVQALGVEALAINLLFAFLCPEEEQRISEAMPDGCFVSCASDVLPEIREYERGIATWLNASVGPLMQRYLSRLAAALPAARISVMQSSGTTVAASQAAQHAVRLLLSGPAGGIAAARLIGSQSSEERLLTLDMGGTSTDVALLHENIPLTNRSEIAGWPLTISTVDIHTIGAGGGSLARVDEGGMLLVGPESAGASPGPACYGQGGMQVTVTDANLLLGRLPPDTLLGGYLPLDRDAAEKAMARLAGQMACDPASAAGGVLRLANEHMARALRVMSVERGHDPRDHALMCFGGAGGLHACDVAELLAMRTVIMPALAGVLSAQGMLASRPGRELSRAMLRPLNGVSPEEVEAAFEALQAQAEEALLAEGVAPQDIRHKRQFELRYLGQSDGLGVEAASAGKRLEALAEAFHRAHEQASGHRLERAVELVNLRVSSRAPAALKALEPAGQGSTPVPLAEAGRVFLPDLQRDAPIFDRSAMQAGQQVAGPCIIVDQAATTWVPPRWQGQIDPWGSLLLHYRA